MESLKFWTVEDFEISSFLYNLDNRKGNTYKTSGSDNTRLCTYTYNELGFRGDSIKKEGFKVMSLGCSNTEGVGVDNANTWSHQFTNLIPNGVDMNFGTGGRSNDFIVRCLLSYYELIKPDLVLIMYTAPQRREIYTQGGGVEPFMPTGAWGYLNDTEEGQIIQTAQTELQNDNMDFINWYKNHLLIKYFLESKNCNWLWNNSYAQFDYTDTNRFDGDYYPFLDFGVDGVHPGPKTNNEYAKKLYSKIENLFPNNKLVM